MIDLNNPREALALEATLRREIPAPAPEQGTLESTDRLPTFVYREALPLKVRDGVPQYMGPLKSLGRARFSRDRSRLYVRAVRTDGTSVWLSRSVKDGGWYLEGLFV